MRAKWKFILTGRKKYLKEAFMRTDDPILEINNTLTEIRDQLITISAKMKDERSK